MPIPPLSPNKLRASCDPKRFDFTNTADIQATNNIIGQPRGTRAIEFGIGIQSRGYNIFVMGNSGTGRATTIQRFLKEQTADQLIPLDWVYVNNFVTPPSTSCHRVGTGTRGYFSRAYGKFDHQPEERFAPSLHD